MLCAAKSFFSSIFVFDNCSSSLAPEKKDFSAKLMELIQGLMMRWGNCGEAAIVANYKTLTDYK